MAQTAIIRTLFLDIGGVLLTNGWDRDARQRVIERFKLEPDEFNERHNLVFDTFEEGKLTLDEYLDWVVFYTKRQFSKDDFKTFMYRQSQPFPKMLELIRTLKGRYGLRVFAVSNENRELNQYRIQKFRLDEIFDAFISSCYVHYRKPDPDIFRLALDISQTAAANIFYLEDRQLFVDMAKKLGIDGLRHERYETTRNALEEKGLTFPRGNAQASKAN